MDYIWSERSDGDSIDPFDPSADRLRFDDGSISAAAVSFDPGPLAGTTRVSFGGIEITLHLDFLAITHTNITFDDGSALIVGDDSVGLVNDDGPNTLTGTDF